MSAKLKTMKMIRSLAFGEMHEKIAEDAGIKTARVWCDKCGREQAVDGAHCLKHGWPECCGHTMWLQ